MIELAPHISVKIVSAGRLCVLFRGGVRRLVLAKYAARWHAHDAGAGFELLADLGLATEEAAITKAVAILRNDEPMHTGDAA
jgi:hypothetical protein